MINFVKLKDNFLIKKLIFAVCYCCKEMANQFLYLPASPVRIRFQFVCRLAAKFFPYRIPG